MKVTGHYVQDPITREDLIIALKEEKRMYDLGYFPKLVSVTDRRGRVWVKTRWIKDYKKTSGFYPEIEECFVREMKRLEGSK